MVQGEVMGPVLLKTPLTGLQNRRLWQVAPLDHQGPWMVCADPVGVAVGDWVLVTRGHSAQLASQDLPVDATILGTVTRER